MISRGLWGILTPGVGGVMGQYGSRCVLRSYSRRLMKGRVGARGLVGADGDKSVLEVSSELGRSMWRNLSAWKGGGGVVGTWMGVTCSERERWVAR